jgi:hypothetical protein
MFAPGKHTKVMLIDENPEDPSEAFLRIYEHQLLDKIAMGENEAPVKPKRLFKIRDSCFYDRVGDGKIHAAITTNMNEHLMLFDETNCYVYNIAEAETEEDNKTLSILDHSVVTHEGIKIQGVNLSDNRYLYAM